MKTLNQALSKTKLLKERSVNIFCLHQAKTEIHDPDFAYKKICKNSQKGLYE